MRKGRNVTLWLGLLLTGLFVAAGLLSLVWTPFDVAVLDVGSRLLPPSATHLLGTDHLGRDLLSMLLAGASVSLSVSLLGVGVALVVGVPLGLLAAARGGWVDEGLMRSGDLVFAFPWLMLAILLAATLGPGASNAVLAIAILNIPVFARLTRGEAQRLWQLDFVAAAMLAGKGRGLISLQHILPNLSGPLSVQATIQFSLALLAEAGLSYVGLGVQPPAPSWGRMLADAQTLIGTAPWLAIVPGLAILLAVFGLTLTGDGLGRHFRRGEGA
ncbi:MULTISPECIES: ABC transporter permease [unclassified Azospirillum]|uniref:ABC transporter permease n=1 Tax=unclassified Azospirillum TaxID=2630922 RepID=UPI000B6A0269|nr:MULTISPECIES: ABC transporter permease [unclassified Azospirillum]SNT22381.1 peptide/nickel transport system permease protein [Azospirillum sp. RU38E]SNT33719.1 peptide/nickel transport system permease protein [Azospirillum sp. RU37A]